MPVHRPVTSRHQLAGLERCQLPKKAPDRRFRALQLGRLRLVGCTQMGRFWALETGCGRVSPGVSVNLAVSCAILIACRLARVCVMSSSPAAMRSGRVAGGSRPGHLKALAGVVLVGGSGPSDRDNGTYFPPIREHLADAGIAVLSYDKRGVGSSSGNWLDSTLDDLAADATAALGFLCAQPEVRADPAGLLGHSEGGWVALRAAAGRDDVPWVITSGCPGMTPGRAGAPRAGRRAAPCWRAGCRPHAGPVRPACRGRPARWRLRRTGPDRQFRPPVAGIPWLLVRHGRAAVGVPQAHPGSRSRPGRAAAALPEHPSRRLTCVTPPKETTQRDGRAASLRCTGRRASAGKTARRRLILPYRRDMPARKRPTPEDAVTARRVLLDGLARDADISGLVSELALLHPRDNTFPGEVFLYLAADALDWCSASRADPLPLEGLRERFLPEFTFRGRETRSFDTQCWPQEPSTAGPNRTCWMRSPGGRPTTSGSTPCSRRSPASGPPPAGRACRCARHARTWLRAPGHPAP